MCLILFAVEPSDQYRLVVAANRDELYARPTRSAGFWADHNDVLAGRDIDAGGTWLGVNRAGYFAAVTNFREVPSEPPPPRSRGELPMDFLVNRPDPVAYLEGIGRYRDEYKGFNLIVANPSNCCYFGNRAGDPRRLGPGTYGLSNQLLDCDWPKVIGGKARLGAAINESASPDNLIEALFNILLDTGDDREFSNSFIASDLYGTRAATVVLIEHSGKVTFEERNFVACGEAADVNRFSYWCNDGS